MIAVVEAVGICQYVVALYFRFIFLELADFRFSCSQSGDVTIDSRVVYFDNRGVGTSIVGCIVHGEGSSEFEMFQEIHFTVDIARCAVVLGFGSVRLQIYVHHRVVDLCLLEFGQGGV